MTKIAWHSIGIAAAAAAPRDLRGNLFVNNNPLFHHKTKNEHCAVLKLGLTTCRVVHCHVVHCRVKHCINYTTRVGVMLLLIGVHHRNLQLIYT